MLPAGASTRKRAIAEKDCQWQKTPSITCMAVQRPTHQPLNCSARRAVISEASLPHQYARDLLRQLRIIVGPGRNGCLLVVLN